MRKLWLISLLVILLPIVVWAEGFKQLTASQQFEATSNVPDTTINAVYVEADSVNVTVVFQDGTPATTLDSVWYNAADAQAISINDQLYFFDAWDDMNGAEGVGIYTVTLKWWNGTGSGFGIEKEITVFQTTMGLEDQSDTSQAILDSLQAQAAWVAQEETVKAIALTGTNITTIAESRTLTDGTETNTFAATQIHDGIYYQVAEGGTGTNLNINFYLEFDIGPNTKAASVVYHGRLDEGSAPSGGDTIHVWVYDWVGTSWVHINAPGGDFIGINGSDASDDETLEAGLVDINYVGTGANVGLVRIAFSNYDPDGAASSNLEETTELYLDYVFLEYQSLLTAADVYSALAQLMADSSIVRGDSSMIVTFQQFRIVDGVDAGDVFYVANTSTTGEANAVEFFINNSNGRAFKIYNNGAGEGMTVLGGSNGLVVAASVGDPVKIGTAGGGIIDGVITVADTLVDGEQIARTGTGVVWELRGLYITAGGTDSAAVQFAGSGTGNGLRVLAHGAGAHAVWLSSDSASGLVSQGGLEGSGDGAQFLAGGSSSYGAYFRGSVTGEGHGIATLGRGATGSGYWAKSDNRSGFEIIAGASSTNPAFWIDHLSATGIDFGLGAGGAGIIVDDTLTGGERIAYMAPWAAGDSAAYQGTGSSAPDSAGLSRILHRVVWGTSKSAGTDSSTNAERDIIVAAFINDIITASALHGSAPKEIADSTKNDSAAYRADVSSLALQTEVVNLNGWSPATDSVNVDMSTWEATSWAQRLWAWLGFGEISGDAIWSQDRPNANADTLWVGTSDGAGVIDTMGYQVIFHVGGSADDPPDSTKAYLWP